MASILRCCNEWPRIAPHGAHAVKLVTSSFIDIDTIFHVFGREICAIARLTGGDPECTIVLKSFQPTAVNEWHGHAR